VKAILDLDQVTLAQVIKWNTGIFNIQDNVFFDRSVLVFEAPEEGANVSVVAGLGLVTVLNNDTGQVLALHSLANVEQIILVGSQSAADFFNLFIAGANGGIEGGVVVYGGNSAGDRLNVYGRLLTHDTFTVADTSFTTGSVDTAGNDTTVSVDGLSVDINGNAIFATGIETTRLLTLGGGDSVIDPDLLALVLAYWDPLDES
jgi:hypothetical protein